MSLVFKQCSSIDLIFNAKNIFFVSSSAVCENVFSLLSSCSSACRRNGDVRQSHSNKRERERILHLHEQERENYRKGMLSVRRYQLVQRVVFSQRDCEVEQPEASRKFS